MRLGLVVAAMSAVIFVSSGVGASQLHLRGRLLQSTAGQTPKQVNPAVEMKADPYWQRARLEVYKTQKQLADQEESERKAGKVLPKLRGGNPKKRLLALTFDDGPHPTFTPRLLKVLRDGGVKATFFVVGKMVERQPDLLKQIAADGHLVANHTFSHVTLTKVPFEEITTEYRACSDIVESVIGVRPRWCRPPGGDYDENVIEAATANGMTTVLWTADPGDFASPGEDVILQRTFSHLNNGGIILLHDGIEQTLSILPELFAYAQARGFTFVTVDELERENRRVRRLPLARH
ncbi:MAG: polysaccharide deacetylase family protein [Fimbriimonas sp.]